MPASTQNVGREEARKGAGAVNVLGLVTAFATGYRCHARSREACFPGHGCLRRATQLSVCATRAGLMCERVAPTRQHARGIPDNAACRAPSRWRLGRRCRGDEPAPDGTGAHAAIAARNPLRPRRRALFIFRDLTTIPRPS